MLICHLCRTLEALVEKNAHVASFVPTQMQDYLDLTHNLTRSRCVCSCTRHTSCQDINQWVPGGAVAKAPGRLEAVVVVVVVVVKGEEGNW